MKGDVPLRWMTLHCIVWQVGRDVRRHGRHGRRGRRRARGREASSRTQEDARHAHMCLRSPLSRSSRAGTSLARRGEERRGGGDDETTRRREDEERTRRGRGDEETRRGDEERRRRRDDDETTTRRRDDEETRRAGGPPLSEGHSKEGWCDGVMVSFSSVPPRRRVTTSHGHHRGTRHATRAHHRGDGRGAVPRASSDRPASRSTRNDVSHPLFRLNNEE